MIALIQRVAEASVRVRVEQDERGGATVGAGGDAARIGGGAAGAGRGVKAGDPAGAGDAGDAVAGTTAGGPAGRFIETGRIGAGLLALVCAERGDAERECDRLLERLLGYRVFADAAGRMNRSLLDVGGALLVVSQFTLAADTTSGARPSFTPAAPAALGERLYDRFVRRAHEALGGARVASGRFGADMRVALVNDGPVTFWLRVPPPSDRTCPTLPS